MRAPPGGSQDLRGNGLLEEGTQVASRGRNQGLENKVVFKEAVRTSKTRTLEEGIWTSKESVRWTPRGRELAPSEVNSKEKRVRFVKHIFICKVYKIRFHRREETCDMARGMYPPRGAWGECGSFLSCIIGGTSLQSTNDSHHARNCLLGKQVLLAINSSSKGPTS